MVGAIIKIREVEQDGKKEFIPVIDTIKPSIDVYNASDIFFDEFTNNLLDDCRVYNNTVDVESILQNISEHLDIDGSHLSCVTGLVQDENKKNTEEVIVLCRNIREAYDLRGVSDWLSNNNCEIKEFEGHKTRINVIFSKNDEEYILKINRYTEECKSKYKILLNCRYASSSSTLESAIVHFGDDVVTVLSELLNRIEYRLQKRTQL